MHSECRKKYCHPNQKRQEKEQPAETLINTSKTRKSCNKKFDYQSNCLFSGTPAKVNHRKTGTDVYFDQNFVNIDIHKMCVIH